MISVSETAAGAALDTLKTGEAVPPKPKRAARVKSATAALKAKRNTGTKAKGKKAATDAKAESTLACEIIAASVELGIGELFGQGGSCVVRIPAWDEFKAKLAPGEAGKDHAQTFHAIREAAKVLSGDTKSTLVIHRSGSVALYTRLSK